MCDRVQTDADKRRMPPSGMPLQAYDAEAPPPRRCRKSPMCMRQSVDRLGHPSNSRLAAVGIDLPRLDRPNALASLLERPLLVLQLVGAQELGLLDDLGCCDAQVLTPQPLRNVPGELLQVRALRADTMLVRPQRLGEEGAEAVLDGRVHACRRSWRPCPRSCRRERSRGSRR